MTERVAEIFELAVSLSRQEREELIEKLIERAERESDESQPIDEETGDAPDAAFAEELGRRLRVARASGMTGEPAGPFLAELRASLRAKSA